MKKKSGIFLAFTLILSLFGCSEPVKPESSLSQPEQSAALPVIDDIEVTLLDVGKADAMVICTHEHTVVIDCGEKNDGKAVVNFLEDKGISTIDYMIITHYDKDHVGGASKVIKKMDVENVIVPDYDEESKEVSNFNKAMDEKNITPVVLTETMKFLLDDAEFTVYPPESDNYADNYDNNNSLVTAVRHGENGLLFAADAMELRLEEIMNIGHFDFLKVPYHGRNIANLGKFLDSVTPEIAAVSTSAEEFTVAGLLDERNISYKATCSDGQISIISNGKEVYFTE